MFALIAFDPGPSADNGHPNGHGHHDTYIDSQEDVELVGQIADFFLILALVQS